MARTETILLLRLLQTPESSSVSNDNDISISSRSSLTKAWDKLQLVGFYRFNSASLASCNQQCLRNQWCTKLPSEKDGKGNCELNKHEISIAKENINFVHQENVLFSMYKKRCDRRLVLLIIYSATITTFSGANPARQARRWIANDIQSLSSQSERAFNAIYCGSIL